MNETQFLQKMFKYFDIQNSGKVDFDQFFRSMEKTGIIMEKGVSKSINANWMAAASQFRESQQTNLSFSVGYVWDIQEDRPEWRR